MVYWVALAGIVGLARRSYVAAALAATWFASYLVIKGSSPDSRLRRRPAS